MGIEAWSDEAILTEVGVRLRTERLNRNLTIDEIAERAGVADKTVRNVETGENYSVATLLRLLRALGLLGRVDALIPEPGLSPIELAKLRGKQRQRATGRRGSGADEETWEW